jgi:hypothetical protein
LRSTGEPIAIEVADFFDFIGGPHPSVVFLAVHAMHPFNRALLRRFTGGDEAVPFGSIAIADLLVAENPVIPFLHQGLTQCGVLSPLAVLPGYYLFCDGRMLAWDSGLPIAADTPTILRGSLLGAVAFVFTRDFGLIGKAVRFAADEASAERLAQRFRAACDGRTSPRPETPPPADEVAWAAATLGVPRTATEREINEAWRRLARECHPDRGGDDPVEAARRGRRLGDLHRAREILRAHRMRWAS